MVSKREEASSNNPKRTSTGLYFRALCSPLSRPRHTKISGQNRPEETSPLSRHIRVFMYKKLSTRLIRQPYPLLTHTLTLNLTLILPKTILSHSACVARPSCSPRTYRGSGTEQRARNTRTKHGHVARKPSSPRAEPTLSEELRLHPT